VVGTHSKKGKWHRQAEERRRPSGPAKIGQRPTQRLVAVFPQKGKAWGLQQMRAAGTKLKKRRRRKKEPVNNRARPTGRL